MASSDRQVEGVDREFSAHGFPVGIRPASAYRQLTVGPGTKVSLRTPRRLRVFPQDAPPAHARKPWPHDANDGFLFDLMGRRVPAIVVSPWIKKHTVFRSSGAVPFDSTSFLATLLRWFGIPKARWGLGDRVLEAPTFEGVLLEPSPRQDAPVLGPAYDKDHEPDGA